MRLDILFIILLGAFLRLYRIDDFYMFLADQGRDAIIARRIATFEKLPLIGPPSSIGEVFLGPFYYYLVAPFMWFTRMHPVGLAIGVGILSVVALVAIYMIVRKSVSHNVAFFFTSILATSGLLVSVGRFSWNPNLLPYASFITLSLFYAALYGRKRKLYSVLFGIAFGLSFQLHHLAALLVLPIGIYFVIYFLLTIKRQQAFTVPMYSMGAFFSTLLPFVLFELRHNFLNTKNLTSLFTEQNLVSSGPFFDRLTDVVGALMKFASGYSLSPTVSGLACLGIIGTTAIILWKKPHPFVQIHLLAVVTLILGLSRVNAAAIPHYYHIVYASLYFVIVYLSHSLFGKRSVILTLLGITLFFASQFHTYDFLWGKPSHQDASPIVVGEFIAKQTNGKRINLATYPVEFTSRDSYQYFIEYYGGSVVDGNSSEVTDTMYVLCDRQPCKILNSQSWNIEMFGRAKIDRIFYEGGIVIYRLKHATSL